MSIKTGLKVLAGAVALALSGGAFAQVTTGDANGTIILNIDDTTNGTSYVFDTGLLESSFTGAASLSPISVAGDAHYQAFIAGEKAGDSIEYSVGGANFISGVSASVLFTSLSAPVAQSGSGVSNAADAFVNFLGSVNNPKGASTYNAAGSNAALGWATGGYETNLLNNAGVPDGTSVGTALNYYEMTTVKPNKTTPGTGTLATLAGTWDLNSAGVLSYTVGTSSPVPLPAPLMLLLSGLGLMGVVARRGKSSLSTVGFDGAAV